MTAAPVPNHVWRISIGQADTERPAAIKPRLPQSAVLSHDRNPPADTSGDVARYDRTMQAFYASQKMAPARWSAPASTRSSWPTTRPCSTCRWRRCGAATR
ncbi:MAG: NADPH-dependent oxidoreductase [Rhodoferax sp.]|nr:NADPH-dependent oxidoreductase [Rhodoferax sp.]